jgi:hypothetical protein
MAWVVDTCLLIDIAEADPAFGVASEADFKTVFQSLTITAP